MWTGAATSGYAIAFAAILASSVVGFVDQVQVVRIA